MTCLTETDIEKMKVYRFKEDELTKLGVELAEIVEKHADSLEDINEILKVIPPGFASYKARKIKQYLEEKQCQTQ